jgi:hypothetical protein
MKLIYCTLIFKKVSGTSSRNKVNKNYKHVRYFFRAQDRRSKVNWLVICQNKSHGQCEREMRVLARYDEYIMQGAQHAGRIQRPECLTITGNTKHPSHLTPSDLSGAFRRNIGRLGSRERRGKSMKETPRKRIMFTSSLNVVSTAELGIRLALKETLLLSAPMPPQCTAEPELLNFYGAQESIPRNQLRQPM